MAPLASGPSKAVASTAAASADKVGHIRRAFGSTLQVSTACGSIGVIDPPTDHHFGTIAAVRASQAWLVRVDRIEHVPRASQGAMWSRTTTVPTCSSNLPRPAEVIRSGELRSSRSRFKSQSALEGIAVGGQVEDRGRAWLRGW